VADLTVPLWQLQVATSIGIIGVWIGWRGGMSKMVGFYDLPTATRLLLYGFFAGAIFQFLSSTLVLDPLWLGQPIIPTIFASLVLSLSLSLLTMFMLTREGVRRLKGQPTAGWTFGLGIGSMLVVRFIYRLFESTDDSVGFFVSGFGWQTLLFGGLIAGIVPWSIAIISSWQGWNALEGRRFKPAFKAMLLYSMLLITLAFGMVIPFMLLMIPPAIIWGQNQADSIWLQTGLSPRMKQEWKRLQRTGVSTGVRSVNRDEEAE
jgi:hypothetical protein